MRQAPSQVPERLHPPRRRILCVGIKSLLNAVSITTVLIDVNAAQSKLVLLENFNENYSKCLRLLVKLQLWNKVKAVKEIMLLVKKVSTAELKFNSIKDAKLLLEAIEKRFGGNEATKKTQMNLLKHQYENFTTLSSEMLDQTFDRLQNLVSQLERLVKTLHEDVNQKLLRSLSHEWNTHAIVWRNKADLKTMSMDDSTTTSITPRNQDNKKESSRRSVHVETFTSTSLVLCDGLGCYDWSDQAEEGPNYHSWPYSSSSSDSEELCNAFEKLIHEKFQMSSMRELTFFLGLQVKQKKDDIFISQDKYVGEILKKFGFTEVKTASTPMETQKPLLKDEDGEEVDVHMYRSMIGSLMYLTSSRLDIMFAVCACARYQVNLKVSHLHAVKKILVLQPGGCQFLGSRLISWQCKKQTVVANSTTEAEYVAASSCCGQVLWIQN
ncbi:uncharacterized mitochondrial protein-like protein [Tanacetum coccineum]